MTLAVLLLVLAACQTAEESGAARDGTPDPSAGRFSPAAPPGEIFVDASSDVGLDFVHFNGMSGELYMVEMMGPGGALFDYDNDGDLDLWLRQGAMLGPGKKLDDALFPPRSAAPLTDRLYRNDLGIGPDGSRTLRFTDVTEATGIEISDYAMGIAAGDYDNDGWVDLYLTNFGPNRMLRNNGDGTLSDVTSKTGTGDDRWSVPAVFADFDRDGWLDLYVGNYIDFNFTNHKVCFGPSSARDYCGPLSYRSEPDRLFRNRGDGTFEDFTVGSGLARTYGNALAVLAADLDGDSWLDLFVANDAQENHLWMNRGDGTFVENGLLAGCAVNSRGEREGSMGVSAGDFDRDGDPDLFLTHMATETNTLYVNHGDAMFDDDTLVAALAGPSRRFTGFGVAWIDFDNDGWLDLLTVNGEVRVIEELERAADPYPLHQTNQLFRNLGNGSFEEISDRAGAAFRVSDVSRGAVFGDVDNDGDTDVVVVNNNGPARLLLNRAGQRGHWLGLVLSSESGRLITQGAAVEVTSSAGAAFHRWTGSNGSYCSASDPRILIGLGESAGATGVRVRWPNGRTEAYAIEAGDTYVTLVEGDGEPGRGQRDR